MKHAIIVGWALLLAMALPLVGCSQERSKGNASAAAKQTKTVGGGCEACELMYEDMPRYIAAADTAPDWNGPGQKLRLHGTVLKPDGRTPATDVILYYYHTDATGHYTKHAGEQTRHGYIRGWVKTGGDGRYAIYTSRPAPYPGGGAPAHIHVIVKEPHLNEYWVDELVFSDDTLLTDAYRDAQEARGGSGVLRISILDRMQSAEHDVILGKNIPDYPTDYR